MVCWRWRIDRAPLRLQAVDLGVLVEQARAPLAAALQGRACSGRWRQHCLPCRAMRAAARLLDACCPMRSSSRRGGHRPALHAGRARADGACAQWVQDNGGLQPRRRTGCSASSSACTARASLRAWVYRSWPWCAPWPGATAARCRPRLRRAKAARCACPGRILWPHRSSVDTK